MKTPLYKVIYNKIYSDIQSGHYAAGDLLPSELELENQFDVSRTPVREALRKLESDGYIYRLQGKGSFVANTSPVERWTMTTGFGSHFNNEWKRIAAKTLFANFIDPGDYAKDFGINSQSKVICLKRIRYINSEPLVYMKHFIKPVIPLELFTSNDTFTTSVGKIIKDELQISFTSIQEELEAVTASEEIAKYLLVDVGFPLLKIYRKSFYKEKLLDINIYYVRTDKWKYQIQFDD